MNAILTIRVSYDDALAPSREDIECQLTYAARHLADTGQLSGEDDKLLVDEWHATVAIK